LVMTNHKSPDTYGLIGYPVKHSLSPAMHNAAFKAAGISAQYLLFEVSPADLEDFLCNFQAVVRDTEGRSFCCTDIKGFNITIPHKVRAKQILESRFHNVSEEARAYSDLVGAINTVKRDRESLLWWNTDAAGFVKALKEDLGFRKSESKDALVFGCGGAGRAVISGLSWEDQGLVRTIYVFESDLEAVKDARDYWARFPAAAGVNKKLKFIGIDDLALIIGDCCLLVNATPVGMRPGLEPLIDYRLLHKGLFVYDVVYNRETELLTAAKAAGCKAAGGFSMLLYQAVLAWELWTKRKGPLEVMKQALTKELE
jgi:shikimate dehydrogenase